MSPPASSRRGRWLARLRLRFVDLYPPFLGAGIRVRRPAPDTFEVSMKLRWWNANYVGTHFGGSLYTMCDPFFMLLLIEGLGPGYVVWDKAATIRFRYPGRGRVRARFHISPDELADVRRQVDDKGRLEPRFSTQVLDEEGRVVAEVEKLLHVRERARGKGAEEPAQREPR